jgi:hypothetical protein
LRASSISTVRAVELPALDIGRSSCAPQTPQQRQTGLESFEHQTMYDRHCRHVNLSLQFMITPTMNGCFRIDFAV